MDGFLSKLQEYAGVETDEGKLLWLPMKDFFLNHYASEAKLMYLSGENALGIVSPWKEDPEIPLVLSAYRPSVQTRGHLKADLYVGAFFKSTPPDWNTTVSFDTDGRLRFDLTDRILMNPPNNYDPIALPQRYVSFLRHLPDFQSELIVNIESYQTIHHDGGIGP